VKRHKSIIPLSKDHHLGLLCCWKIRQGIRKNIAADRIRAYVLYFWETHLVKHFYEEEQLLFNKIQDPLNQQAITEHQELQSVADEITGPATFKNLNTFADLLEKHIRFEERVLFPYLETIFPEEELQLIGEQLEKLHSTTATDDFDDEFWV
jgi:hemerythrin-like domain-containing protein